MLVHTKVKANYKLLKNAKIILTFNIKDHTFDWKYGYALPLGGKFCVHEKILRGHPQGSSTFSSKIFSLWYTLYIMLLYYEYGSKLELYFENV